MSNITSVILSFSPFLNKHKSTIENKLKDFTKKENSIDFKYIGSYNIGGNMKLSGLIYISDFNSTISDNFVKFIHSFEEIEINDIFKNIQILFKLENDDTWKIRNIEDLNKEGFAIM